MPVKYLLHRLLHPIVPLRELCAVGEPPSHRVVEELLLWVFNMGELLDHESGKRAGAGFGEKPSVGFCRVAGTGDLREA